MINFEEQNLIVTIIRLPNCNDSPAVKTYIDSIALHDYCLFIDLLHIYVNKRHVKTLFQVQFRPKRKLKKIKHVLSSVNREAESASTSEPNSTTFQCN